jgi:hypothetical protein
MAISAAPPEPDQLLTVVTTVNFPGDLVQVITHAGELTRC